MRRAWRYWAAALLLAILGSTVVPAVLADSVEFPLEGGPTLRAEIDEPPPPALVPTPATATPEGPSEADTSETPRGDPDTDLDDPSVAPPSDGGPWWNRFWRAATRAGRSAWTWVSGQERTASTSPAGTGEPDDSAGQSVPWWKRFLGRTQDIGQRAGRFLARTTRSAWDGLVWLSGKMQDGTRATWRGIVKAWGWATDQARAAKQAVSNWWNDLPPWVRGLIKGIAIALLLIVVVVVVILAAQVLLAVGAGTGLLAALQAGVAAVAALGGVLLKMALWAGVLAGTYGVTAGDHFQWHKAAVAAALGATIGGLLSTGWVAKVLATGLRQLGWSGLFKQATAQSAYALAYELLRDLIRGEFKPWQEYAYSFGLSLVVSAGFLVILRGVRLEFPQRLVLRMYRFRLWGWSLERIADWVRKSRRGAMRWRWFRNLWSKKNPLGKVLFRAKKARTLREWVEAFRSARQLVHAFLTAVVKFVKDLFKRLLDWIYRPTPDKSALNQGPHTDNPGPRGGD